MKTMKILATAVAVSVMAGCSVAPNKLVNGEVLKVTEINKDKTNIEGLQKMGVDGVWLAEKYNIVMLKHIDDFASGAGGNAFALKSLNIKEGDYVQMTTGDWKNPNLEVEQRMPHVVAVKPREDCKWVGSALLKKTLECKGDSAEVWK